MIAQASMTIGTSEARAQFHELLERHRKIVFKVANTYAREAEDRADLAQEIVAQCWRAFPGYDASRSFSTWIYRIALNVAISFVRGAAQRDRHSVALDESLHDIAVAEAESDERVRELHRCIDRLDPLNRALLMLYLDERSYRDIAEILGISETNVATKIGRLKQRIRADMTADQI
jgi:RNA polymerase sigma factor (sigma-70 family)